jgi:hypothetical protein
MTENKSTRKPLLFGSDYGADVERMLNATEEMQGDPGWIPGYSEQVRANEIGGIDPTLENFTTDRRMKSADGVQLREHYIKKYGEPKPLPVRLKWVRVVGMDGTENQNVRTDMITYLADGYRPVTLAELRGFGYGMPPAATEAADGTIRRGDVALMAVDAERAFANDARKARENAEREQSATADTISVERSRESNYVL